MNSFPASTMSLSYLRVINTCAAWSFISDRGRLTKQAGKDASSDFQFQHEGVDALFELASLVGPR